MTDRDRLIDLLYDVENARNDTKADYLLANGVIVSPLKLGDKIYKIFDIESIHRKIVKIEVSDIEIEFRNFVGKKYRYNYNAFTNDDFGKTVFLTKEEAEAELEKRCNNA